MRYQRGQVHSVKCTDSQWDLLLAIVAGGVTVQRGTGAVRVGVAGTPGAIATTWKPLVAAGWIEAVRDGAGCDVRVAPHGAEVRLTPRGDAIVAEVQAGRPRHGGTARHGWQPWMG